LAALRSKLLGEQVLLAGYRLYLLMHKASYDPDQPRVPAGSSDGGQWTGTGGAAGALSDN
jgi:hypothetical protein